MATFFTSLLKTVVDAMLGGAEKLGLARVAAHVQATARDVEHRRARVKARHARA